ncbi:MAG TPA: Ig-like domain-containing protein [Thermoleophilaceae bacterium]|nr:Ig-like domain-containing protein [Thermoleophilaceae bacterium]
MAGALAAVLLCAGALAGAPSASGAAVWTEIDSVPGTIMDFDADRVLYRAAQGGPLAVKDRRTDAVTQVPSSTAFAISTAFLTPQGAIWSTGANVYEWRNGTTTPLLATDSSVTFLKVAGAYALFGYRDATFAPLHLLRRDLNAGTNVEVSSNGSSSGSHEFVAQATPPDDIAANGDVAIWEGSAIYRWRNGTKTLVADAPPGRQSPRTDGTNIVWLNTRSSDSNAGTEGRALPDPSFTLDDFTGPFDFNDPRIDARYRLNGGWIAYTTGGSFDETVRTRDPSGNRTAISLPGDNDVFGLSASGEVIFGTSANLFLKVPGQSPLDVGSLPISRYHRRGEGNYLVPLGGRWYAVIQGSLRRLGRTDGPPTDGSVTSIDSGPQGSDQPSDASFSFSSSLDTATFQCQLDGAGWEACISPKPYSGLDAGQHTFLVRAVDSAGNVDPEPAQQTWSVEGTPPTGLALLSPADGAKTNDATPTLDWQAASDPTSGVDHYDVFIDGNRVATDVHATQYTPPGALTQDEHNWQVKAVDGAGNVESSGIRFFRVDTTAPVASLRASPNPALTGGTVTLDASSSTDQGPDPIARFEFDADGDGTFERDSGSFPQATASYPSRRDIQPAVRITDAAGNTATASVALSIRARPPAGRPGVSINDGDRFTNSARVTVNVVWVPFARRLVLSNDGGFGGSSVFPVMRKVPWRLRSSGSDLLPRTIYARFLGAGSDNQTYQDDIVLDRTIPRVISVTSSAPPSRRSNGKRTYHLRVRARDNVSGVSKMQITTNRSKPGEVRAFQREVDFRAATARIFVRVRDRAGNFSGWKRLEE